MKSNKLTIGLSAIALCAALGGIYQGAALAGSKSSLVDDRAAAQDIAKAKKALADRHGGDAVRWAEAAVELRPQIADYRAVLGQAYLLAGRFASARTTFNDALTLSPGDGKVALNMALAQIAEGDWTGARQTLDSNSGSIPVGDRGLAMALAGDPTSAVNLLLPVARQPGADAKLRQNLALSLALAGRWQDARVVAAMDMSPTDADKRIVEWAAFARPASRYDQVAALLGVTPASDPGQPVALALNASTSVVASAPAPVDAYMPKSSAEVAVAAAPVDAGATTPAVVAAVAPTPAVSTVVFGPRAEVVQPLPVQPAVGSKAPLIKAPKTAIKAAAFVKPMVAPTTPGASKVSVSKGNFYVQLGAYDSAGVARDAWGRASRAYSGFSGHAPTGMSVTVNGKNFYRLSVGGFDRAGAAQLCSSYRAKGGTCFVRASAGDQAVSWKK
jgi:Flp pilus assembly protein TadD/cell division protein FtsN